MTARDEHLAGVLCHCDQTTELPQDGHPLGTSGCASVVKAGRYGDGWCTRDHGLVGVCNSCHGPARGTCPTCGKSVRVVQIQMRSGDGKVLYGAPSLGMAPHRLTGQDCPGVGAVPTETTYTSGRALAEYLAARQDGAA